MDYIQIKIDRRKHARTPTHTISKKQTHLSVCTRLNKHSTIAVLSRHLDFITRNISVANARRAESNQLPHALQYVCSKVTLRPGPEREEPWTQTAQRSSLSGQVKLTPGHDNMPLSHLMYGSVCLTCGMCG